MWSKVFSCVTDVGPNEFHRIEFRCTGREGVNVQTRFRLNKALDQASLMNRMVVPDQYNRTRNAPQELFEEKDHVFTMQICSKRSHRQLYFPTMWTHQESTKQIQSSMVVQAGICTRCLTTRRPTASKWRNQ
jgi:hypothetical protein